MGAGSAECMGVDVVGEATVGDGIARFGVPPVGGA
jgi:hypothetical protein